LVVHERAFFKVNPFPVKGARVQQHGHVHSNIVKGTGKVEDENMISEIHVRGGKYRKHHHTKGHQPHFGSQVFLQRNVLRHHHGIITRIPRRNELPKNDHEYSRHKDTHEHKDGLEIIIRIVGIEYKPVSQQQQGHPDGGLGALVPPYQFQVELKERGNIPKLPLPLEFPRIHLLGFSFQSLIEIKSTKQVNLDPLI